MASPINILIAEDETNIALALKTIIQKATGAYITTVTDGRAALNALDNERFDLLISDWNMPQVTGIDLLSQVRANPRTAQLPFLMLTARADASSVRAALGSGVTDYIAKPFDKDKLIEKVQRFLGDKLVPQAESDMDERRSLSVIDAVAEKLQNDAITFPVLPEVAFKAVDVINSDDVSQQEVANIIKTDASLSSRIIATANSPYYRAVTPIQDLEHAIRRIGLRESANIILVQTTRGLFNTEDPMFEDYQRMLWRHTLATATGARLIGRQLEHPFPERLYAAAMLHDMGKNLLIPVLMELAAVRDDIDTQAIDDTLDTLHVEFGVALLERWRFPGNFIETTASHHDYQGMRGHSLDTQVVSYANLLTRHMGLSLHGPEKDADAFLALGKLLGIQSQQLDPITQEISRLMEESINAG